MKEAGQKKGLSCPLEVGPSGGVPMFQLHMLDRKVADEASMTNVSVAPVASMTPASVAHAGQKGSRRSKHDTY